MNRVLLAALLIILLTTPVAAAEADDYVWSSDPSSGNVEDGFCYPGVSPDEDIDCNTGPSITNRQPADSTTVTNSSPVLRVEVDDAQGDQVTVNFTNEANGNELYREEVNPPATVSYEWTAPEEPNQYTWSVSAYDGQVINSGDSWTFTVGVPPDITCTSCANVSLATVGGTVGFDPTISDSSSFSGQVCLTRFCNRTVVCSFTGPDAACIGTVDETWQADQDYWIHARDEHGNSRTVRGGDITVQQEALELDNSSISIEMGETAVRSIRVTNSENTAYQYRITTTIQDPLVIDTEIQNAEPTGQEGQTFTVGSKEVRELPMIVRSAQCLRPVCPTTLTVTIENLDTQTTYTRTINVQVVREGASASGPGITLLQLLVLIAAAAGAAIIQRR